MSTNMNLVAEMTAILEEYRLDVQREINKAAKEAADLTQRQLQQKSPKRKKGKGRGKYARGWKVKRKEDGAGLVSYVVYNGARPGLTHVLEHGHVARNQYGSYGRVRAIPHIGPAADAGIQRFDLSCRARIRRMT